MAVLRPHLALTVTDVERSIPFYEALFGTAPEKRKPGYAKFSVAEHDGGLAMAQQSCGCGSGQSETECGEVKECCAA